MRIESSATLKPLEQENTARYRPDAAKQNAPGQVLYGENVPGNEDGTEVLAVKSIHEAVDDANKVLKIVNKRFEFSIHEETGRTMVKIIDRDTNEVISEIPPEKILDMLAKIWEAVGLIIDRKV